MLLQRLLSCHLKRISDYLGFHPLFDPVMWLAYTAPLWIIGLLVFVPALLEVYVERREGFQGKIVFTLGMGLVGIAVHMEGEGLRVSIVFLKRSLIRFRPKRKGKEKPKKKKKVEPVPEVLGEKEGKERKEGKKRKKRKKRKERPSRGIWEKVQRTKMLFERYEEPGFRCIRSIFRALHLRDLILRLEIGLEDPAQTGFLAGWAYALNPLTGRRVRLDLTPNFTEPCFRGAARLRVHIGLYRIIWVVLRLTVDIAPDLIRSYLLPRLRWPKRAPGALANPEAPG